MSRFSFLPRRLAGRDRLIPVCLASVVSAGVSAGAIAEPTPADPWGDSVVAYVPGTAVPPGFGDPSVALGPPARDSGAGIDPGVVSPFQPAFSPSELVSVGRGGHLVIRFDEPVLDDPANPFGVDLLVFGNAFFIDLAPPAGFSGGHFAEGGLIDVSADGETWIEIPGAVADGGMPTLGWLDAGPYDVVSGREPSDFTRPVDPAVDPATLAGTTWTELLDLYAGSGGGSAVDLAVTGLAAITHVRIRVPEGAATAIEVDAVVDVAPAGPAADVTGDGLVGFDDLLAVLAAWGACPPSPGPCPGDVDGSGSVDFGDLLAVLAAWTVDP